MREGQAEEFESLLAELELTVGDAVTALQHYLR